ncbi:hypothetical protein [Microbacterium sp.]|uniref:hypothetical protein n=1 Tax=Microbacterium sp. TaxID=51671 RepID=UPI0039E33C70
MRSTAVVRLGAGLLALILVGCSPVPADPHAVLEEKAASVDAATQDVLESLDAAGLSGASAHGSVDGCQSEPAPGAAYRAGISVTLGEDLVTGFNALVEQLEMTGWADTHTYDDVDIPAETPAGRLTRDDITLDIKTGGSTAGGVQYGADEMDLGITIADDCVRIPDGAYFTKMVDLEKEILPRE